MTTYDIAVIGAGIVGLATARELHRRHPRLTIAVVDKEDGPGRHQSGHNSGVLHSGVYYQPGSLKARLCVQGKQAVERYAAERGIPYETCGKVIVAVQESELSRLADLEQRGRANGVAGLRMVGAEELREIEPYANGIRALVVPGTGIIDFARVVASLAADLRAAGVEFFFDHRVVGLDRIGATSVIRTSAGEICAARVISCAGLQSDRVARLDAGAEVAIMPFRGDYYTLTPEARGMCRGLIYPVPDPALPFLGVHFTRRIDGAVWAGPNAVLATAREGYRRRDLVVGDVVETLRSPGFPRLARSYWRTGATEIWRDVIKRAFLRQLQRYLPALTGDQIVFGPSGVRAQAVAPDGSLVDDFRLSVTPTSLHVLNAPSPAATASLAIAGHLVDEADRAFALPPERLPRTEPAP